MSGLSTSIIIPTLNEAPGIAAAVARGWDAGAREVIVVDGGSDDLTPDIARVAGATVLAAPRGRAAQQNIGARHAAGDVLLFLHADTWLVAGGVRQIEAALRDPRVQCGAFRQRIEAPGIAYRVLERGNAWRARRRGLPYGDQGIFTRRKFYEEVGGFPEVRLLEDVLLMRAMRRRTRPVLLEGPLFVSPRRWQRNGVIRQTLRNWLILSAAKCGVSPDRLARYY